MLKRIITFVISSILLLGGALAISIFFYSVKSEALSLESVFAFHIVAASVVYILVELTYQQLPNQAGYAYLASVFIKAGLFMLIYMNLLFGEESLVKADRLMLLIPLFLGLLLEGLFIAKLLKLDLSLDKDS